MNGFKAENIVQLSRGVSQRAAPQQAPYGAAAPHQQQQRIYGGAPVYSAHQAQPAAYYVPQTPPQQQLAVNTESQQFDGEEYGLHRLAISFEVCADMPPPPSPLLEYGMQQRWFLKYLTTPSSITHQFTIYADSPPLPPPPPPIIGDTAHHMPDLPIYGTMAVAHGQQRQQRASQPSWVPANYIEKGERTERFVRWNGYEVEWVERRFYD